jgi:hypothetical protein
VVRVRLWWLQEVGCLEGSSAELLCALHVGSVFCNVVNFSDVSFAGGARADQMQIKKH